MSSRIFMLSLQSIEPIRKAIGSKDRALFDAFAAGKSQEFRAGAKTIIMEPPPAEEPGSWCYVVEPLAQHLGLSPHSLPISEGDWKQIYVWSEYRAIADPRLSEQGTKLLAFLDEGRPFVGTGLDYDGCMFGWLTAAEVKALLAELTAIDAGQFDDELGQFHKELLEALHETAGRNADLFFGAG